MSPGFKCGNSSRHANSLRPEALDSAVVGATDRACELSPRLVARGRHDSPAYRRQARRRHYPGGCRRLWRPSCQPRAVATRCSCRTESRLAARAIHRPARRVRVARGATHVDCGSVAVAGRVGVPCGCVWALCTYLDLNLGGLHVLGITTIGIVDASQERPTKSVSPDEHTLTVWTFTIVNLLFVWFLTEVFRVSANWILGTPIELAKTPFLQLQATSAARPPTGPRNGLVAVLRLT